MLKKIKYKMVNIGRGLSFCSPSMCSIFERTSYIILFESHSFCITSSISNILPENTLGEKIKKIRSSLGLSQNQFGEKLNRGLTTVANWENGVRKPPQDILDHIINMYKLDKNYFKI